MRNNFYLANEKCNKYKYVNKVFNLFLNHDYANEYIEVIQSNNKTLVLIGDFVNAKKPTNTLEENAEELFKSDNLQKLLEYSRFYAGRFLVFYGKNNKLDYIITDPVVSIPVNYTFDSNNILISSHAKIIANELNIAESEESIKINNGAEQQQPLPYDITMYDEIKTLIPNHYLDVKTKKAQRFFPIERLESMSLDEAAGKTISCSKKILEGYKKTRKISLPITSGIDSRAVLALMRDYIEDIELYTYELKGFTNETGDIAIPKKISKYIGTNYHILPVLEVPSDLRNDIHTELAGLENDDILNHGYTYSQSILNDRYSVPGDIISIAKSPFGKDLPESFATLSYLLTKTHNYSAENKYHVNRWMEDTVSFAEKYNVSNFDLFNFEYRLGRWLPKSIQNYDYFIDQVYIFNCRYLIELWLSVPREERTKRSLHIEIIKKEWPELLEFEINPDDKIIDKLTSNSFVFYIGSHVKYVINKYKK